MAEAKAVLTKGYLIVIVVVCAVALLLWSRSRGQTKTNLDLPASTTDAQLGQELRGLTKLECLGLVGCDKITDAGLAHLKGLTKLLGSPFLWRMG